MKYPGRLIKKGEKDKKLVKTLQNALNKKGCGPIDEDGDFGPKTVIAVKLFQARYSDQNGTPLTIDGTVGPLSWASLFGADVVVSNTTAPNSLLKLALKKASSQVGIMENPLGSNNGKEVNMYQDRAGIPHGLAWCMAFVYWCFDEAAKELSIKNPVVKTGGVLYQWNKAKCKKITCEEASADPSLVKPGQIFIISISPTNGHTGIVEKVEGGILFTIEGNTNDGGSREGIGVYRRRSRKISSINKGFLEY